MRCWPPKPGHSLPDVAVEYADGRRFELAEWKDIARAKWANFKQASSDFAVATGAGAAPEAVIGLIERLRLSS